MNLDSVLLVQVVVLTAAGLHQSEIADKTGVSQGTVSRYAAFARGATAPLFASEADKEVPYG